MRVDEVFAADGVTVISSTPADEPPPSALDACSALADAVTLDEVRDAATALREALQAQGVW